MRTAPASSRFVAAFVSLLVVVAPAAARAQASARGSQSVTGTPAIQTGGELPAPARFSSRVTGLNVSSDQIVWVRANRPWRLTIANQIPGSGLFWRLSGTAIGGRAFPMPGPYRPATIATGADEASEAPVPVSIAFERYLDYDELEDAPSDDDRVIYTVTVAY